MLSSAKLECIFSVGPVVLSLLLNFLPQEPQFDLPRITGRDLQEVAWAKKSTAGWLDGWAWNEIKALPLPWFSGLAILLELVETTGVWPQGLLYVFFAMIPYADGDYTPLGQRPLSVLVVVYRLWASLRLGDLREWVEGWLPRSVFSLGNGLSSVEAWFSTALDFVVISCMLLSLMSLSPLILLIGLFWIVFRVAWVCLTGFVLDLVSCGVEMVAYTRAVL